jgi:heme oxygenase
MRLVDRLGEQTAAFRDVIDGDTLRLLGSPTAEDYRRYLLRMYGFVCPLERSIANTPDIERHIDVRRFQKQSLLRRDLMALRMTSDQVGRASQCAIPWFKTPEEALGWAYPIEWSTLHHAELFRHLASILPGEVAFASSYLKCYFGTVGESWKELGCALDAFEYPPGRAQQVIASAKAAFYCLRGWRFLHNETRDATRFVHMVRRQLSSSR